MDGPTFGESEEALRPIASLISKLEKALQKLAPGTWQRAATGDNLEALRVSLSLMRGGVGHTRDELRAALAALASLIRRTERARPAFPPGTSQQTLLSNRLRALRTAEAVTAAALDRCGA